MLLDQIKNWFKTPFDHDEARSLYGSIVAQARQPAFYRDLGVPDNPDGRFDMIALHAFVVMRRLRDAGNPGQVLSQALFDLMFADFDQNMREMGVGDHGLPKRMKKLAESFMGRIGAYDNGVEKDDDGALGDALRRNLYRKTEPSTDDVLAMTTYIRTAIRHLDTQADSSLQRGSVDLDVPIKPARTSEA